MITACTLRTAFCNSEGRDASGDIAHITSLDTKGTERVDKIDDRFLTPSSAPRFSITFGNFH